MNKSNEEKKPTLQEVSSLEEAAMAIQDISTEIQCVKSSLLLALDDLDGVIDEVERVALVAWAAVEEQEGAKATPPRRPYVTHAGSGSEPANQDAASEMDRELPWVSLPEPAEPAPSVRSQRPVVWAEGMRVIPELATSVGSYRSLAVVMRVGAATVYNWKDGQSRPRPSSMKVLKGLCNVFGVDFSEWE